MAVPLLQCAYFSGIGTSGRNSVGVSPRCLRAAKEAKMLFRKTPTKERNTYTYHFNDGSVSVIPADGETEVWIKALHSSDDSIVYNNIKNSRPPVEEWQKEAIRQWKEKHPGEEVPKNWNLSLDGLKETEDVDHSSYMKEIVEKTDEADPLMELLHDVVADLPEDEKKLYVLRYQYELSQKAIAAEFGVSQNTVSKRLRKLEEKITNLCRKAL